MKPFSKIQDKKILIFSIAYYPFIGGAEVATKEITDRIGDFSFDMITLRFGKKSASPSQGGWPKFEKIGNINVYRIDCLKLFFPLFAFLEARKLNKKNSYDLIWSIMANRAGFAALFFKIFHPKTKYILTLQEGDVLNYPQKRAGIIWPFVGFLFKWIFTRADYIQTISNYLAGWARDMGAKNHIEVVPNGVDVEKFRIQSDEIKSRELKQKLGIKSGEKILITASRLVYKNAVDDVIKSLKYLPENIRFLILGDGPDRSKLADLAENLYLSNRIIFFGAYYNDDLPQYLEISDVFIRPSLSEGQGISFLEAMAAGIPVIGTSVGGIVDFLKNEKTGLFCEVNNPKSIAEKVKLLLKNDELREKIVANAKEMVAQNYDWNLIAVKMNNIFGKLVKERA